MLRTLQAGRAIAAICVAAFHLSIMMGQVRYGGEEVYREYTKLGNRGVDFFFVLSGFIILFAHFKDIDKPKAWANYVYRRFVRLYPIYWIYTIGLVVMLLFVSGSDAKMPATLGDWLTSLTLIRFTDGAPPLPPAWTLFHELAFYAVFSILILSRRVGLIALSAFVLIAILNYQFPAEDARNALNVYTAAYNLYFVLGMGAFWLYKKGGNGYWEFIVGLCVFVVATVTNPLPHHLSPIVLASSFAFILAGATKIEASGKLPIPYFLVIAGDASYTIYLAHSNIEGTLLKIAIKIHLKDLIGSGATFMVVLVGTILLGCAAFLIIEKPLLNLLRRHKREPVVSKPAQEIAVAVEA
jgi:exopolysaccharide production protein ExoZ